MMPEGEQQAEPAGQPHKMISNYVKFAHCWNHNMYVEKKRGKIFFRYHTSCTVQGRFQKDFEKSDTCMNHSSIKKVLIKQ